MESIFDAIFGLKEFSLTFDIPAFIYYLLWGIIYLIPGFSFAIIWSALIQKRKRDK